MIPNYRAKFILLSTENNNQSNYTSFERLSVENISTITMQLPFLCPVVYNLDDSNSVVNTTRLRSSPANQVDVYPLTPLDYLLTVDRNINSYERFFDKVPRIGIIDYAALLQKSDLSDFELDAGVYYYEPFIPNENNIIRSVSQYLLYFEKI